MLLIAEMRNGLCGSGSASFLAPLLAGLLGCSTSGAQSTTVVPGTTAALSTQLATAFCAAQAAGGCGARSDAAVPDASAAATSVPDGGASTCLERATLSANQQLALVSTAFSEGLLTISPTIATTCVAAYASNCTALAGQSLPDVQAALDNPACANLFTGYIPAGERCDMTAECVTGSYCLSQGTGLNATEIAGSGTLGVCFPFQGMGGACDTTQDCLPPLTCNATMLTCE